MKKVFPLIIALALGIGSVNVSAARQSTISTSTHSSDEIDVKNFDGVIAGGPISVIITLGNKEGLRFEGDEEAISTLVGEVKGNKLTIRPKASWTSWAKKYENKKITAYVNAKTLTSITMSGDGSITVSGTITAAEFTTTLSGSGSIKATVEADKVTGVMSGSGNVNLSGKAGKASVTLSGSGNYGGKSFTADEVSVRISGSGSVNVKTDGSIKATILGSGHVYYTGNPDIEKSGIGSGSVSKMK